MSDNLKKLYDELYSLGYHGNLKICHTLNLIKNGVSKKIKKPAKILDVGCSNGSAMVIMANIGYEVYGVDISEIAVKNCLKSGLNCKVSETHNIDFDMVFDGITCTDVLEHVMEENIDKTFKEFNRLLKVNGLLLLKIALSVEKNRKWDNVAKKYGYNDLHISVKDRDYWLEVINNNNFLVDKITIDDGVILEIILIKK